MYEPAATKSTRVPGVGGGALRLRECQMKETENTGQILDLGGLLGNTNQPRVYLRACLDTEAEQSTVSHSVPNHKTTLSLSKQFYFFVWMCPRLSIIKFVSQQLMCSFSWAKMLFPTGLIRTFSQLSRRQAEKARTLKLK